MYIHTHTDGVQYTKFSYHDIGAILSQCNMCITAGVSMQYVYHISATKLLNRQQN